MSADGSMDLRQVFMDASIAASRAQAEHEELASDWRDYFDAVALGRRQLEARMIEHAHRLEDVAGMLSTIGVELHVATCQAERGAS